MSTIGIKPILFFILRNSGAHPRKWNQLAITQSDSKLSIYDCISAGLGPHKIQVNSHFIWDMYQKLSRSLPHKKNKTIIIEALEHQHVKCRKKFTVDEQIADVKFIFINLGLFVVLRHVNSQGHITTGSLQVDETSAYCTVNHRASASDYQLSNMKCPARGSNRRPQSADVKKKNFATLVQTDYSFHVLHGNR